MLAERNKQLALTGNSLSAGPSSSAASGSGFQVAPDDQPPPQVKPPRTMKEWCQVFDSYMTQRDKLEDTLQKIVPQEKRADWQMIMDAAGL